MESFMLRGKLNQIAGLSVKLNKDSVVMRLRLLNHQTNVTTFEERYDERFK